LKNGKMERVFHTIQGRMLAMLIAVQLPIMYWGEATLTTGFLFNLTINTQKYIISERAEFDEYIPGLSKCKASSRAALTLILLLSFLQQLLTCSDVHGFGYPCRLAGTGQQVWVRTSLNFPEANLYPWSWGYRVAG
jgi:hypothetical protein